MIYRSGQTAYAPVMEVLRGDANDILICRDAVSESKRYYTLLAIHDHEIVRQLLCVLEQSSHGGECCLEVFWQGDVFCAVFPHVKERCLRSFYMPAQFTVKTCYVICENLILACMLSKLPYPLLNLALAQEQLHLRKDYSVALGYTLELDELDVEIGEKECARQCAALLRELLKPAKGEGNMAYRLFMKKWDYETFDSLYRDMKLVGKTLRKQGRIARLRLLIFSRRKELFLLLRAACMGIILLALMCLLCRAVWGELPFLRVFVNHFKVIGTESLTK